ncbi:hypothetical protein T440DRAFT_399436 [Plenodomus tracheiphilus IPT5]|uniref:Uncharacterized protein n=1 Tax=Plenodomus tracheiphilus IPT5 TaxID=1408161 RepID=A0A6A7B1J0_9PLEO|nr:hypothetical protein T440DRAFT_399436 [Plenodomus tracheiphilus IPT5]
MSSAFTIVFRYIIPITRVKVTVTRECITDSHWSLIKDEREALGYDREAYEHSLQLPKLFKDQSTAILITGFDGEMMLLFRLGGLLDTHEKVKKITGLEELPRVMFGTSETGLVKFCAMNAATKNLKEWLTQ